DTLHSSRHVRVEIDGVMMGETRRPVLLFETGLLYYIPKLDMRMDLLEPSESVTRCPYKGVARYWSGRVGENLVKDIVCGVIRRQFPSVRRSKTCSASTTSTSTSISMGCSKTDQSRRSLSVQIGILSVSRFLPPLFGLVNEEQAVGVGDAFEGLIVASALKITR